MNAVEEAFRGGSKDPPAVIYGVNPLREALLANPGEIRQIYVAPGTRKAPGSGRFWRQRHGPQSR